MKINKNAVTIGLIASAILGAGYGYSTQSAPDSVLGYSQLDLGAPLHSATFVAAEQAGAQTVPPLPIDMRAPLQPVNRPLMVRAVPDPVAPSPAIFGDTDDTGRACQPALDAAILDRAIAVLALDAPCNPNTRVDIRHAGLEFSGRTDAQGRFGTAVPALTILARFEAVVGAQAAEVTIAAPEAAGLRRIAVYWQGAAELGLHAFEFGAPEGGTGHIWGRAPGRPGGAGGSLMRLGQQDLGMAEVYSYPTTGDGRAGIVDVSLQAAVTDQTCGRALRGTVIQTHQDRTPRQSPFELAMPDCGLVDGIRVLKKPVGHMTIAGN